MKSSWGNFFKFNILAASAVAGLHGPAYAAESEAASIEEIVVTGSYSRALEKAVEKKRHNIGFSDSIISTDIADFPEQNLAEALQRMPGVTIEREKGLGTKVNVRSLPNEFTHVSINGLATASGSGGRDVQFDVFASEIIQSVTIQKSPTAANEEGGIAGSVQIATARPFDYDGRKLTLSAQGAYNSISEKIDPQVAMLASNTWGDWGALVSFSYSQRTNRTDSNSGVDFRPLSRWLDKSGDSVKGNGTYYITTQEEQSLTAASVLERDTGIVLADRRDPQVNNIVFLNKVGNRAYLNDQEKWGTTASLQYKPDNNFSLTFDAMYGQYNTVEDEYDAAAYSASSNSTLDEIHAYDDTTLADYGIVVLTDTSYAYTQHEFLSKERVNETEYSQFSANLDWSNDHWAVKALAGYSGADKFADHTNLKHTAYAPSRSRYTELGGEVLLSDNENSIDMYNSPELYYFEGYEVTWEDISDDKYAAQLDVTYSLGLESMPWFKDIQVGVRYTDKSKKRDQGELIVQGTSEGDSSYVNTRRLVDSDLQSISDLTGGGAYLDGEGPEWMQISNDYARDFFRWDGFAVDYAPDQFYQVDEEVLAAYAMANFEFDLGGMLARLNAGARFVDTKVNSFGYHQVQQGDGSVDYTAEPVSKEGSYDDVLPSFNLTVDVLENVIFRAAYSQTLMRPALTDLAYKRTVSVNDFKYRDGNPDLMPTYADQWEIGLEWYLENGGILAASLFHKTIEGVVEERLTGTVEDVLKYNADGSIDGYYDFDIYQKVNAEGSYDVKGVELIAVLPFNMFHNALDGFGINANYTFLDSSLTGSSDLDIPTPPAGLADNTFNVTLYYENDSFDARFSYNYKDKYVEYVDRDMYPVYRDAYGQLDMSVGYWITDNIKAQLKGINILDAKTQGYTIDPAFPTTYEMSGRRISLGIRANF